jgi:uncharacterized membrane protein YkvA (DUF1232 family)
MKSDPEAFLKSEEFAAFVQRGGAEVTPATLHRLAALLPELREKFAEIHAPGFPAAPAQFSFLALVVEAVATDAYRDLSYGAIGEAAFALLYLSRDVDIIPDMVEDIGYLDDAAVAAQVIQRHAAEFGEFSAHVGGDPLQSIDPTKLS